VVLAITRPKILQPGNCQPDEVWAVTFSLTLITLFCAKWMVFDKGQQIFSFEISGTMWQPLLLQEWGDQCPVALDQWMFVLSRANPTHTCCGDLPTVSHLIACSLMHKNVNFRYSWHFVRHSAGYNVPNVLPFVSSTGFSKLVYLSGPPLWSSGQIQRSRVRFPGLPDFLRSSGSGTGSTQPR
jgi:hypothetical protein